MSKRKKVLICPLNWGLGHATRDVPIIKTFLRNNFEVFVAAHGISLLFLKNEFPQLKFIDFEGYNVRYSRFNTQLLKMFFLTPKIIYWSIREHRILKEKINKFNIDIVVSDNRYGCWNRNTYNIFITHQLKVKFPGILSVFEPTFQILSERVVKKFNECWIPDYKGENNLSGELAHVNTRLKNITFIGPLSRFILQNKCDAEHKIDVLFILSGPEPQRSILEEKIYKQTLNSKQNIVLVRGTNQERYQEYNFPVYDLLNTNLLQELICRADTIICRSGYSTIMDLVVLNKKLVLIPTPGQTEQEYLASYHLEKGTFYSMSQNEFNLEKATENAYHLPFLFEKEIILDQIVKKLEV